VVCLIRTGSAYERASENGICALTQSLLMKGTRHYDAGELAIILESAGISMNTGATEDYAEVSAIATVDQLDKVLKVMSELVFYPTFPPDEIAKEKNIAIAAIRLREDDKFYLTLKNLRKLIFSGHPYALSPDGEPDTIASISHPQILEFHKRYYKPANMILSVVGDVPPGRLKKCVRRYFGRQKAQPVQFATASKHIKPKIQTRTLKKPVEQGFVTVGYIGAPITVKKDYAALRVACALVGEGMASRLFTHLRDKQGLAYTVGSFYSALKLQGAVVGYIGTRPETIANARRRMRRIFENLCEKPIPQKELERAKSFIIGKFLIAHQTNIRKAFYPAWFELLGLGYDYDEKYPELIQGVTGRDVRRVARKYFRSPCIVTLVPETPPARGRD